MTGGLPLVEAVTWLANRQYESERDAWPALQKALLTGKFPGYILHNGRTYEADRAQFAALPLIYCREQFCRLEFAPAAPHDREVVYFESPMGIPTLGNIHKLPWQVVPHEFRISGPLLVFPSDLETLVKPPKTI